MSIFALSLTVALAAELPDVDQPLRTGARAPHDAAVVVGIEDYLLLPDVPHAGRDARAITDFLISTRGVPVERVRTLTAASREQIVAAVAQAGASVGGDGTVWVYFAGHGVAAPSDGRRLLLGDDARQAPEAFEARGVALDELEDLADAGGGRVVMLVDACFNGASRSGEGVAGGTRFAVPDWAAEPRDTHLRWAAAGPDQVARPLDAVSHGAFTWLALGALRGWADGEIDGTRDGQVTAAEAQVYVSRAMRTVGITEQEPVLRAQRPDGWVLSTGSLEAAPAFERADFVVTAPSPASAPVVGAMRYHPDLLAAAATYDVSLPLSRGMFDLRDAAGERVRGTTYMSLVRATPEGRKAIAVRTTGIALTAVGWVATMGFGFAALASEDGTLLVPAAGGVAALGAGIGLTLGGQTGIQNAVLPRPADAP